MDGVLCPYSRYFSNNVFIYACIVIKHTVVVPMLIMFVSQNCVRKKKEWFRLYTRISIAVVFRAHIDKIIVHTVTMKTGEF